jgi:hypothetical protein
MPQFRVLKKSTRERIYVDKIDPREHLHVTGREFTSSDIADISLRNGSNSFKVEEKTTKPEVKVEVVEATAPSPTIDTVPEKKEKKAKNNKLL